MPAFIYMLRCKDDSLYTGWTNDLQHRLAMHAAGKGAKYTRGRGPLTLVYSEELEDKEADMKREYAIKNLAFPEVLVYNVNYKLNTRGSIRGAACFTVVFLIGVMA